MQRQVVIIHGGSAYRSYAEYLKHLKGVKLDLSRVTAKRWKDSFAHALGRGFAALQPKMPCPDNATYVEWEIWFKKFIPFIKSGAVLVGHSLGGIFLAKYLATHRFPKKLKATILIAPPFSDKGMDESLGDFKLPASLKKFAAQGGRIFIYHSADDPVVPLSDAQEYLRVLPGTTLRLFRRKKHFNQPTFPELVSDIRSLR
jgi:uncharacterized protein